MITEPDSARGVPAERTPAPPAVVREPSETLRILYVGGWGRSGSTLLALMVGEVPGFVNVGEVRDIWLKGRGQNRLCGCGSRFRDCAFWARVGEHAFGGWERVDTDEMVRLRAALDRPWCLPLLALPRSWRAFDRKLTAYVGILERLYRAIQHVSGAAVIVDSSKFPSYALLLSRIPGAEVRLVHLVRDSRGVAFSWQRRVTVPDSPDRLMFMPRYSSVSACARYLLYNLQTSLLRPAHIPRLLMRYEDLVADPVRHIDRALAHTKTKGRAGARGAIRDGSVVLSTHHTVMGNPIRLARDRIKLQADEEWLGRMGRAQHLAVTAMTLPLLLRYRYPLLRGGSRK